MAIHTRLRPFIYPFTAFMSPIWRVRIMDGHMETKETITGVEVNSVSYTRVFSHANLRATEKAWMLEDINPRRFFIHFENNDPPFIFTDIKFRVQWEAEPIIINVAANVNGDLIMSNSNTNIITFRERTQ